MERRGERLLEEYGEKSLKLKDIFGKGGERWGKNSGSKDENTCRPIDGMKGTLKHAHHTIVGCYRLPDKHEIARVIKKRWRLNGDNSNRIGLWGWWLP